MYGISLYHKNNNKEGRTFCSANNKQLARFFSMISLSLKCNDCNADLFWSLAWGLAISTSLPFMPATGNAGADPDAVFLSPSMSASVFINKGSVELIFNEPLDLDRDRVDISRSIIGDNVALRSRPSATLSWTTKSRFEGLCDRSPEALRRDLSCILSIVYSSIMTTFATYLTGLSDFFKLSREILR